MRTLVKSFFAVGLFLALGKFDVSADIDSGSARPAAPEVSEALVAEVGSLLNDAAKYSQFDFSNVEQVDQTVRAQRRIREMEILADWALVLLFERDRNSETSWKALEIHKRFNTEVDQTFYALWVVRKVISESLEKPEQQLFENATLAAADYLSLLGGAEDLPLLERLMEARKKAGEEKKDEVELQREILVSRIAKKVPRGQMTHPKRFRPPFYQRRIFDADVEGLKKVVADRVKSQSPAVVSEAAQGINTSDLKNLIQKGHGDGAFKAAEAMKKFLETWNPVGRSAKDVKDIFGNSLKEDPYTVIYQFDTGYFGWAFEFVIERGKVVDFFKMSMD